MIAQQKVPSLTGLFLMHSRGLLVLESAVNTSNYVTSVPIPARWTTAFFLFFYS